MRDNDEAIKCNLSDRKLISIIGTGKLGSAVALQVASRELADLRLVDIIKGLPQGEALDLAKWLRRRCRC